MCGVGVSGALWWCSVVCAPCVGGYQDGLQAPSPTSLRPGQPPRHPGAAQVFVRGLQGEVMLGPSSSSADTAFVFGLLFASWCLCFCYVCLMFSFICFYFFLFSFVFS